MKELKDRTGKICKAGWVVGTIREDMTESNYGQYEKNTSCIMTEKYIKLRDVESIEIHASYSYLWFAYDEDKKVLGHSSENIGVLSLPQWSNQIVYASKILEKYPLTVYLRITVRKTDNAEITVSENLEASGIRINASSFYDSSAGAEIINTVRYTNVATLTDGASQDGAIYNHYLFRFNGRGTAVVYDIRSNFNKIAVFSLPKISIIKPHSNSVVFSKRKYDENDEFPLIYCNVYNNYKSSEDKKSGYCLVYRIVRNKAEFSADLVQVIHIGFTENASYWPAQDAIRPYGNFVIDTDRDELYCFVMRDHAIKTSPNNDMIFLKFDLPEICGGEYDEAYGCNVVTLQTADIVDHFKTEWFNFIQGAEYKSGKILSLEGFSSDPLARLRVIDLKIKKVIREYNLYNAGLMIEPEMISYDDDILYFSNNRGDLYTLDNVNINC